jgi:hypothetical protein
MAINTRKKYQGKNSLSTAQLIKLPKTAGKILGGAK